MDDCIYYAQSTLSRYVIDWSFVDCFPSDQIIWCSSIIFHLSALIAVSYRYSAAQVTLVTSHCPLPPVVYCLATDSRIDINPLGLIRTEAIIFSSLFPCIGLSIACLHPLSSAEPHPVHINDVNRPTRCAPEVIFLRAFIFLRAPRSPAA